MNVYKPPSAEFDEQVFPSLNSPSIVLGDFNSHNTIWGYENNDCDGDKLFNWMIREDFSLLLNASDPGTFHSARWNRSYTPDLCFVSKDNEGNTLPANRRILRGFPNSQHRPIIVRIGLTVPLVRADKRNRWNFGKADWEQYQQLVDQTVARIPPYPHNYDRFVGLIQSAAKKSIPRGHRDAYAPGWSSESQELYESFKITGDTNTGKQLLNTLDENRRLEWENKMNSFSFAKPSKKAWNLLNGLTGKSRKTSKIYPISADQIAKQLIKSSQGAVTETQKKSVNKRYLANFRRSPTSSTFVRHFSEEELYEAISEVECGKAPGTDNIFPNFLVKLGPKAVIWLTKLFSNIHQSGNLPRAWKMAKVIAVLKANKSPENPKHYRPISLLSCSLKLFERAFLSKIRNALESVIPEEQAGFQKGRNCCDQVLALTNFIELGFQKVDTDSKKSYKTGVVFLDLTAAYDTVWKRGLMYKLSKVIPCRKTLSLLMNNEV